MRECPQCRRCFEDSATVCPDDGRETEQHLAGPLLLNNRYRLTELAGPSTLGRVYVAGDQNLIGREVVVRVFDQPGIDAAAWNRLAATIAGIQHENVVEITDYGTGPGHTYFVVMDRLEFRTLQQLIRLSGKLKISRAMTLLKQIAAGVESIHASGLLHGALNPNNVFVETRFNTMGGVAEEEVVKISDFGWDQLRTLDTTGAGPYEQGRVPLGAVEFLSPEQVQPGRPLDGRIDVYGLGALAYYTFSGRPPYAGDLMQVVVQKMMSEPPALEKICPEVPDEAAQLIMSALNRDASKRPNSLSDWMLDLEAATFSVQSIQNDSSPGVEVMAPAGTTIYLDEEEQGEVDEGGIFSLLLVQPGVHLVAVKFPDGKTQERLLEIPATSTDGPVRVSFSPATAPVSAAASASGAAAGSGRDPSEPPEFATVVSSPVSAGSPSAAAGDAQLVCDKCGAAIRATSKFCRACGAAVKVAEAPPSAAATTVVEAAVPLPSTVEPEPPKLFMDTLDRVGGEHFDVANPNTVIPEPVTSARPETVESKVASVLPEAPPAKARPNSYYLTVGGVIGLVLLIVLGGIGFAAYWFYFRTQ